MSDKNAKIQHVGSVEAVDFPEQDLRAVPAKIDTGADSSAIWASDIRLSEDGELSFVLFGEGSQFYSGERLTAGEYERVKVSSANGRQVRYKVPLLVSISGRDIRGWFTLADRSRLTYPVLIGRRTLHKRFVVDVSKNDIGDSNNSRNRDVLVLASVLPQTDFFTKLAKDTGAKVTLSGLDQLLFAVRDNDVSVVETVGQRNIADFGFVFFKSSKRYFEFAATAACYLAHENVNFADEELASFVSYDKLTEIMKLSLDGMSVPPSFGGSAKVLRLKLGEITDSLGWPLVVKEVHEDRGRQNYLLSELKEVEEILDRARPGQYFIIQKYVKNDGYLRCYVFGDELALTIKRTPVKNKNPQKNHLNNPAGSANASLVPAADVPREVLDLAKRAAMCLNRQVAGIDLIFDLDDKQWRILEVNSAPQLLTGSHKEEKLAAFKAYVNRELA